jgi:hypothetical protein
MAQGVDLVEHVFNRTDRALHTAYVRRSEVIGTSFDGSYVLQRRGSTAADLTFSYIAWKTNVEFAISSILYYTLYCIF